MDAMRGMDPSTSMFQTQASRNLSQIGFGAVRNQKEVIQEDDHQEVQDQVKLSAEGASGVADADEMADNAAMSGELGELVDDYSEDEDEVRERHHRTDGRESDKIGQQVGYTQDLRSDEEVNRLTQLDDPNKAVENILKDIPQRSLEPARNIVSCQVQNGRPAEALVAMKPVEGVNAVDYEPAASIGMLDIHDSNNQPMVQDPTAGVSAETQAEMASKQMDTLIANLPEDRKAVVEEMRGAVNAWASSRGIDAKGAFAERLRDLAAGWDDESLKVASQTFAEASGVVTSAANAG